MKAAEIINYLAGQNDDQKQNQHKLKHKKN